MSRKYNRQDHYYRRAKSEGYRSRAAYKLLELNKRYRLIEPGTKVLDLGAWPGGWMQAALGLVGSDGSVVGIDLKEIDHFNISNAMALTGDVGDPQILEKACEFVGGQFDLVLSDMSPRITGIKTVDRCAVANCGALALRAADQVLRSGGQIALKLFPGAEIEEFVKRLGTRFNTVTRNQPKSSRRSSTEFYVIGKGFRVLGQKE